MKDINTSRFKSNNFSSNKISRYLIYLLFAVVVYIFSAFIIKNYPYYESINCGSNYVCSIEKKYIFSNKISKLRISKTTNLDYDISISRDSKTNSATYHLNLFFKDADMNETDIFTNSIYSSHSRERCREIYKSVLIDFNSYKLNPSKNFYKENKGGLFLFILDAIFWIAIIGIFIAEIRKDS